MDKGWIKSSRSNGSGGSNCVEVKIGSMPDGSVLVRDSKNPTGGSLVFTQDEWRAFIDGAKAGEFDI